MARAPLPALRPRRDSGFRWRSAEVSRLEGFSDAVFGFAVTLLVVSLETPATFAELATMMRGLPAFAASFAILVLIWHAQHVFFRRYGLDDRTTLLLNIALLFVVLLYVYPLKFLSAALVGLATWGITGAPDPAAPLVAWSDWERLMVLYGAGFTTVFAIFALLYRHAYRLRAHLALTPLEAHLTHQSVREHAIMSAFGVVSVALALAGYAALAGWLYVLIGPVQVVAARRHLRAADPAVLTAVRGR